MARESTWTRKSFTVLQCEEVFQELELEQFLMRLEQDPNYVHTIRMELPGFKKLGQSKIQEEVLESAQAQAHQW